jgi:ParB/RepB/Spo0J family partition protein
MTIQGTVATVSVEDIHEPKINPNHMGEAEFQALVAAIRQGGFFQPPLVRKRLRPLSGSGGAQLVQDGFEVVDGVHRVRAARIVGLGSIPAMVVEMTDEQAAVFQVSMNKLRGALDLTATADVVRTLADAGASLDLLSLTGFSDAELKTLLDATKTTTEDDIIANGAAVDAELEDADADAPAPKPFLLELTFATAAELRKVKRVLKKAGAGDLATGLLRVIDGA